MRPTAATRSLHGPERGMMWVEQQLPLGAGGQGIMLGSTIGLGSR
jgi:hypothetical protein